MTQVTWSDLRVCGVEGGGGLEGVGQMGHELLMRRVSNVRGGGVGVPEEVDRSGPREMDE